LLQDNLTADLVCDYHLYPIADNEIPQLSADRLEYMFPSGMALDGSWTLDEIKSIYSDISILQNEEGLPELGFNHTEIAEEYCRHFCMIGHILQLNENKLTLHLLGQVMNLAVEKNLLQENDFMTLSEAQVIEKLESNISENDDLASLYRTFRNMTEIVHCDKKLDKHFCVNLKVKQRYINPLVKTENNSAVRLDKISDKARTIISDFLNWEDTPYGCVKLM